MWSESWRIVSNVSCWCRHVSRSLCVSKLLIIYDLRHWRSLNENINVEYIELMKNEIAKDMKTESRIEDLFQSLKSHEISIKKWRWVEYQSRSYPSSSRYFSMISIQWFSSLILNICHQNLHWNRDLIRDHQYLTLSDSLLKKHWKILVTNCSLMISDISLISWASRNILFNGYIVSYFYHWFDSDLEQLDS